MTTGAGPARHLPARLARAVSARCSFAADWLQARRVGLVPYLRDRTLRRVHTQLDEAALRATRRSDTLVVFGSGASLNDLGPADWEILSRHDTLGFNYFCRQRFIRVDYHLVAEVATGIDTDPSLWVPAIAEYVALIDGNPFYAETILGLQEGWAGYQSNRIVASGLLRPRRVFRYRRVGKGVDRPPTRSLAEGLVVGTGSLASCVNFGVVMGFREIVLAGVDLRDSRYFWLPPDVARPDLAANQRVGCDEPHPRGALIAGFMGRWGRLLEAEGIRLSVLNPASLLADVLPLHRLRP